MSKTQPSDVDRTARPDVEFTTAPARSVRRATLYAMTYSPWSEKARWALDHHRVPYEYKLYTPMLGEPLLRLRALRSRTWPKRVTVPALLAEGSIHLDSLQIALYAERNGSNFNLFRDTTAVTRWNDLSERALQAARILSTARALADREAQVEFLPPFITGALRPKMTWLARFGAHYLERKYRFDASKLDAARATYREALLALRQGLADAGAPYLVAHRLSYADMTMAVTLQFVVPVSDDFIRIGPLQRRTLTDPELAVEFADLVAWRDDLYQKHRR